MQGLQTEDTKGSLVLTRQIDESLIIGRDIMVQVIGISGDRVKLRIVAPKSVVVHRQEVFQRIGGAQ